MFLSHKRRKQVVVAFRTLFSVSLQFAETSEIWDRAVNTETVWRNRFLSYLLISMDRRLEI